MGEGLSPWTAIFGAWGDAREPARGAEMGGPGEGRTEAGKDSVSRRKARETSQMVLTDHVTGGLRADRCTRQPGSHRRPRQELVGRTCVCLRLPAPESLEDPARTHQK